MTVGRWLRSRTPPPPAALTLRLEEILAHSLDAPVDQVPAVFLAAGERLVTALLRSDSTSRESALDLLAADALVTYAFEAAGEGALDIDERAAAAMGRISAIASAV